MWKNRHKRTFLECDGVPLTFDLHCADEYQEDRFLIKNIPQGTAKELLNLHMKSQSVLEDVCIVDVRFCDNPTEAIVLLDDNVAGIILVFILECPYR